MTEFHDPRSELEHEIEVGNTYEDSRTDDTLSVVYVDDNVVLLRNTDTNHRLMRREEADRAVGAGRYSLTDEGDSIESGPLEVLVDRQSELESEGGRKASHKAEALREAIETIKGNRSPDRHDEIEFEDLDGIGQKTAASLRAAGYSTKGDVRDADREDLLEVSGLGEKGLESIEEVL